MSRRTKLALIILVGILLLALGIFILLQPYLSQRAQVTQPPALPTNVQPSFQPGTPNQAATRSPGATQIQPAPTPQDQKLAALEQRARSTVERIGSGSSSDGFLGYTDILESMTAAGQAAMLAEQQAMQKAHPMTGPQFGITTHAVSGHVTDGTIGDATIVIAVDAIQVADSGDPTHPTSTKGKTVTVTFAKQADGSYLIDSITWADKAI